MKRQLQKVYLIGPIIIFISLILIFSSIDKDHVNQLYERQGQIEEVIKRYAIACYAQEGAYPEDLAYLEDNYGLILDNEKYVYYYDLFASNILPDIEVNVKKDGR